MPRRNVRRNGPLVDPSAAQTATPLVRLSGALGSGRISNHPGNASSSIRRLVLVVQHQRPEHARARLDRVDPFDCAGRLTIMQIFGPPSVLPSAILRPETT
jgi:hypothetical protein